MTAESQNYYQTPAQRRLKQITMWNHEEHLSNLQEVRLPAEGSTALNIDEETHDGKAAIGCDLCGIKVTSYNVLKRHLEGRRHKMRAQREGKTFECHLCPISANSQSQLDAHLKSIRHRNRVFKEEHGYDANTQGIWIILFFVACIFLNFVLLFKLML